MAGSRFAAHLPLLAVLICPGMVSGQGAAMSGIRGTVTNANADGAALEGVHVEIRHEGSGRTMSLRTDGAGRYIITNLLAGGPHTLTASAPGYVPRRIDGVHLQAGTIHVIDFVLDPGVVTLPQVEVRARADPQFDSGRSGAAWKLRRIRPSNAT
jgi:hypothetical protein